MPWCASVVISRCGVNNKAVLIVGVTAQSNRRGMANDKIAAPTCIRFHSSHVGKPEKEECLTVLHNYLI